jgi:uncharacterized membrane protein YozB (DUF420 family)
MSKLLFETGVRGLMCRIIALCLVLTLVLMLFFGLRYAECLPASVTPKDLIFIFGLVVTTTVLGQIFSEYPTGDEALMTRLNLTIAARSGLLLVATLLLMKVRDGGLEVPFIAVLVTQYCTGLFFGIYLDACRLSRQDSA